MRLDVYKYSLLLLVAIFIPFRASNIIFSGLGWSSVFPIILILYVTSCFVYFYWFGVLLPNKNFLKEERVMYLIKLFYVLWVLLYVFSFFSYDQLNDEFITNYAGFILSHISHVALGWIVYLFYNKSNNKDVLIIWILSIIPVLMIGSIYDISINYKLLFGESGYDYLLVGDIVVFSTFLCLLKIGFEKKTSLLFSVVILISVFVLFKNGSRTSFYAFVFSLLLVFIYVYKLKFIKLCCFLIPISLFGYFVFDLDFNEISSSRIFMIFESDNSSSLGIRQQLHNNGLKRIIDNFYLGDFLGQVNTPLAVSPFGSYMHSILSHFAQFGIVGFLLYLGSWGYLVILLFKNKILLRSNETFILFSMLVYSMVCLIFSRAFVHTIFELYWCFIVLCMIGIIKERRNNHNEIIYRYLNG